MAGQTLYLHVKRRNQTFCFLCHEDDTVLSLKQKIAECIRQHNPGNRDDYNSIAEDPSTLRLLSVTGSVVLEDEDALSEYRDHILPPKKAGNVSDSDQTATLHVVFPVGDQIWEAVDIRSTESALLRGSSGGAPADAAAGGPAV